MLDLALLPYLKSLLPLHAKAGAQPDNLCGPYWIGLLLQTYGISVSAVEVAIAAATVLPSQGNPTDWLPAGATSRQGRHYDQIPTVPNVDAAGTAIIGLMQATEQLSQGRFSLLPLTTDDWAAGLQTVWQLCQAQPEYQAIPLLNVHTSYFWGSKLTPLQAMTYLAGGTIPPPPPDWRVGHFALLAGQLQGPVQSLYALLDTYPQFGWQGLHLQPPIAVSQSLARPQQSDQGGLALFVETAWRSRLADAITRAGLHIEPWDNGSPAPFCPE
ncbi:MAG: hypothetical protein ACFB12_08660 [Leptolyngbyaceae cyanobacterium]